MRLWPAPWLADWKARPICSDTVLFLIMKCYGSYRSDEARHSVHSSRHCECVLNRSRLRALEPSPLLHYPRRCSVSSTPRIQTPWPDDHTSYLRRPTASCPHPLTRYLITSTEKLWKEYVQHNFVIQLGKGTLPRECFVHFIKCAIACDKSRIAACATNASDLFL